LWKYRSTEERVDSSGHNEEYRNSLHLSLNLVISWTCVHE
jgi:hypothetical protein